MAAIHDAERSPRQLNVEELLCPCSPYCLYAATSGELDAVFHPATALGLDASALQWFRVFMLADMFGFYLAVLIVGGHLWSSSRTEMVRSQISLCPHYGST
jgi:hypothetical protein